MERRHSDSWISGFEEKFQLEKHCLEESIFTCTPEEELQALKQHEIVLCHGVIDKIV